MSLFPPTRAQMLAELERELGYRRRLYPGWVTNKKMSQAAADRQIAALEAVRDEIARGYPLPPGISEKAKAVVLYFMTDEDLAEFVNICKEAMPGAASYHVP
jgi:hypothetical protein